MMEVVITALFYFIFLFLFIYFFPHHLNFHFHASHLYILLHLPKGRGGSRVLIPTISSPLLFFFFLSSSLLRSGYVALNLLLFYFIYLFSLRKDTYVFDTMFCFFPRTPTCLLFFLSFMVVPLVPLIFSSPSLSFIFFFSHPTPPLSLLFFPLISLTNISLRLPRCSTSFRFYLFSKKKKMAPPVLLLLFCAFARFHCTVASCKNENNNNNNNNKSRNRNSCSCG
ncbi:hypothetical protein TbgDal_V2010 [Trypanosoma brucei gambiense DAL972]|uniref:Uncharacterized protein n=1 Tax=Trypanosoma brucei gambiense (strain MHOM/CI/86/DAL972) TaxID=679716 RepID=C9ZNT5_TRYB9|nr:hypothetical protein TbgDal_V2010 [Trypanosoma brucei gambiense DAL972]CBH11063.1 hypothetical protein TbgDal_V2010 [Trypanosoma brucei gambiense DAL972]|eukprot:XP_011773350.1 hypothetical protein TbgDal_V2010 [Trypanosoma brucei gambiense DAL972]